MNISINVKLYALREFTMGDITSFSRRDLVADVTKVQEVDSFEFGYALRVLNVVRPICLMFKTFCSSFQYLALLETISYTVRESLLRSEGWFHATDYEDFQVVVETKLIDKED